MNGSPIAQNQHIQDDIIKDDIEVNGTAGMYNVEQQQVKKNNEQQIQKVIERNDTAGVDNAERKSEETNGENQRQEVSILAALAMIFTNTAAFFVPEGIKNHVKQSRIITIGVIVAALLTGSFIGLFVWYGECESYNVLTRKLDGMDVNKCVIDPNSFFITLRLDTHSRWELDSAFSQSTAFWQVKFFGYGSKNASNFQNNLDTLRKKVNTFLQKAANLQTFELLQYFLHTRFLIKGDSGFAQLMPSFGLTSYASNFELSQVQFFRSNKLQNCASTGNLSYCDFQGDIKSIKSCGGNDFKGPILKYDINRLGSFYEYYEVSRLGTEFKLELNLLKKIQGDDIVQLFDADNCDLSSEILGNASQILELQNPITAREVPYFEECTTCRVMDISFDLALINALDFCNKNIKICSNFYNIQNSAGDFSSGQVYVRIKQITQSRYRTSSASFYDDKIGKFAYTKYKLGNEYSIVPEIIPSCNKCSSNLKKLIEEPNCFKEFDIIFHYYLKRRLNISNESRKQRRLLYSVNLESSNIQGAKKQLLEMKDQVDRGDILWEAVKGTQIYTVKDYAAAILTQPVLIGSLNIALYKFGCDIMRPLIVELQCFKNQAPEQIVHQFTQVINQYQQPDMRACLDPYETQCKDVSSLVQSQTLSHLGFIGSKSYYYSVEKLSWTESFQRCQSLGGNLLQLESEEIETTINVLLQTNPLFQYTKPLQNRTTTALPSIKNTINGTYLWIGLQNIQINGSSHQKWSSNVNLNYDNVCRNQNYNFTSAKNQQPCVATFFQFENKFPSSCWEYLQCQQQNLFICEFNADLKQQLGIIPEAPVLQPPPPPPPPPLQLPILHGPFAEPLPPPPPPPPPTQQVLTDIVLDNNDQSTVQEFQYQEQQQIIVDTHDLQPQPEDTEVIQIEKSGYEFKSGGDVGNPDSYYQFSVLVSLNSSDPQLAYNQFQTFMPKIQCDGSSIEFIQSNQSIQVPFTLSSNIYECEVERCFSFLEKLAMAFANTEFFYIFIALFMLVAVFVCCTSRQSIEDDSGSLVENIYEVFAAMIQR